MKINSMEDVSTRFFKSHSKEEIEMAFMQGKQVFMFENDGDMAMISGFVNDAEAMMENMLNLDREHGLTEEQIEKKRSQWILEEVEWYGPKYVPYQRDANTNIPIVGIDSDDEWPNWRHFAEPSIHDEDQPHPRYEANCTHLRRCANTGDYYLSTKGDEISYTSSGDIVVAYLDIPDKEWVVRHIEDYDNVSRYLRNFCPHWLEGDPMYGQLKYDSDLVIGEKNHLQFGLLHQEDDCHFEMYFWGEHQQVSPIIQAILGSYQTFEHRKFFNENLEHLDITEQIFVGGGTRLRFAPKTARPWYRVFRTKGLYFSTKSEALQFGEEHEIDEHRFAFVPDYEKQDDWNDEDEDIQTHPLKIAYNLPDAWIWHYMEVIASDEGWSESRPSTNFDFSYSNQTALILAAMSWSKVDILSESEKLLALYARELTDYFQNEDLAEGEELYVKRGDKFSFEKMWNMFPAKYVFNNTNPHDDGVLELYLEADHGTKNSPDLWLYSPVEWQRVGFSDTNYTRKGESLYFQGNYLGELEEIGCCELDKIKRTIEATFRKIERIQRGIEDSEK